MHMGMFCQTQAMQIHAHKHTQTHMHIKSRPADAQKCTQGDAFTLTSVLQQEQRYTSAQKHAAKSWQADFGWGAPGAHKPRLAFEGRLWTETDGQRA